VEKMTRRHWNINLKARLELSILSRNAKENTTAAIVFKICGAWVVADPCLFAEKHCRPGVGYAESKKVASFG
jgi:hypothetical protein